MKSAFAVWSLPEATREAYLLVHEMKWLIPPAEQRQGRANPASLPQDAREEWEEFVDRLGRLAKMLQSRN